MMIKHLVKNGEIDKKTIFANGQSGDFITGNHIPQSFSHRRYEQEPDDINLKNLDEPMFKALQPLEVFRNRRKPSSHQKFTPGTNNRIGRYA